ncbi:baseplate assembly protein [Pseudodesulfovibrio indicus]|uniref:Uncharacterized protein n=1 Tax=Pseudodesulfovibrio indicus TaxID=1716143 RepID=A0AA94TR34_9BACT|nr:hypothetical protein EDC59_101242 [Pseudodesulfovibrio indicus]
MGSADLKALLKRVVEIAMPNLRAYYRVVRKAKIVATYPSEDGRYWADVQPLCNDDSVDEKEPVIPRVEIPIMWAGPNRGVVCPPLVDSLCDLEYYDGDPDYPRISNFRWTGNGAPACEIGAYVIHHSDGTYIKIDAGKNILEITPANATTRIGTDMTIEVGGSKTETIGNLWTLKCPLIIQEGNVQSSGPGGAIGNVSCKAHTAQEGSLQMVGPIVCTRLTVLEDAEIGGNLETTGNSYAGSRSGGTI